MQEILANPELACAFTAFCVADALLVMAVIRTWRKNKKPFRVEFDEFRTPRAERKLQEGEQQAGKIWIGITNEIIRSRNMVERKARRVADIRTVEANIADENLRREGRDPEREELGGWKRIDPKKR